MSALELLDDSMDLDDNYAEGSYLRRHDDDLPGFFRTHSLEEPSTNHSRSPSFTSEPGFDEEFRRSHERGDLNSSFDLCLLSESRSGFNDSNGPLRIAASWDENDNSRKSDFRNLPQVKTPSFNGKAQTLFEGPELPPPSTRNILSRKIDTATPLKTRIRQPALKKSIGKLTPASAKRHKVPLHHTRRSSPHQLSHKSTTPSTNNYSRGLGRTSWNNNIYPDTVIRSSVDIFGGSIEHFFDHEESTPPLGNKRPPKRSLGTTTTAASSLLETTTDTIDSTDTHDTSTPFRFTTFPASLPRISNNIDLTSSSLLCPGTIRKRMTFAHALNQSREDECTHNTSVSSIQDDTYGYSDDDSTDSPPVTRTRLNFNSASPLMMESRVGDNCDDEEDNFDLAVNKVDLSRPYEQTRMNSFASSVSSLTKNLSHCEDIHAAASTGLTPSRDIHRPQTPNEVQIHFQLDAAQCSPIRGIPEEEGDVSSKSGVYNSRKKRKERGLSTSLRSAPSSASSSVQSARPMPDMNAFDGNRTSPPHDRSDESGTTSSKSHPISPKLLCPPTPVRTPAWAQSAFIGHPIFKHPIFNPAGHTKFARSNSLITTKVLATCPPQVLDGRASLENSILEEAMSPPTINQFNSENSVVALFHSDNDIIVKERNTIKGTCESNTGWLHKACSPPSRVMDTIGTNEGDTEPSSMATSFEILSILGKGNFADVYKVKSKVDGRLYAVKRNRRRFRGKRDREAALSEVRSMQRLQSGVASTQLGDNPERINYSLYLLFFFQAWQEDGHFFCQTELCCRDTCRELMDSLRSKWATAKNSYPVISQLSKPDILAGTEAVVEGRQMPEEVTWKVCHDICAGLSHMHSLGLVHNDIKPSNILFGKHPRLGALCKIGDFGMTRTAGSKEDGQEGDQKYMARELLHSGVANPSADIFSLGLTLYEMCSSLHFFVPCEGPRWHDLRNGQETLDVPMQTSLELIQLIKIMMSPDCEKRPSAESILAKQTVADAGRKPCIFLRDYLINVDEFDTKQEERALRALHPDQTPRTGTGTRPFISPPISGMHAAVTTNLCSPDMAPT